MESIVKGDLTKRAGLFIIIIENSFERLKEGFMKKYVKIAFAYAVAAMAFGGVLQGVYKV